MKKLTLSFLTLVSASLLGCNVAISKDDKPPVKWSTGKPTIGAVNNATKTKYYEERYLPNEIRKKLGLEPDDIVVAMTEKKGIIFISESFGAKSSRKSLRGKKFINSIELIQTMNSPQCIRYRDAAGNTKYWPVPDCPH